MTTRIHLAKVPELTAEALAPWGDVPVSILSDVTGGRVIADRRLFPLRPLGTRMVGQALTAFCDRADFGPLLHGIDRARPGQVLLVEAGGWLETAFMGEILGGVARRRRLAGIAVTGAVRDTDLLSTWPDLPIYALGRTARGPLSKEMGTLGAPIIFGGVSAASGDIVVGDNDGLAVIPLSEAPRILDLAQRRQRDEEGWVSQLASGISLVDVFQVPEAL